MQLWKYFCKNKTSQDCNVTLGGFYIYFSNLENDIFRNVNVVAEDYFGEHDFHDCKYNACINDRTILTEVILAIGKLKSYKANCIDFLLNDVWRGITLRSVMNNRFTTVLNERMIKY